MKHFFLLILPLWLLIAPAGIRADAHQAQTFHNPILTAAADPYITCINGRYYLLYTDVGGSKNNITVRSSASLAALGATPAVPVYSPGGFFESPELFHFGKLWYIYYTRYPNTVNVLESDTDNPQGKFHFKTTLTTNTYDADLLQMPNRRLYLLSSDYGSLRIQPLSNPYTVSGPQVSISVKDKPWETLAIEAPNAFRHHGNLFILYSAGGYNRDNYAAGVLRFNGGDPASPGAWTKLPGPLLTENPAGVIWDAGVPSAFSSPDGRETWFAYSDYSAPGGLDKFRCILAQPMRFDAQGNPVLGPALPLALPLQSPP